MLTITKDSPAWPAELERVEAPPERLWLRGRERLLAVRPRIAIVGSRSPTPYGEAQARRFGMVLAEAGVLVVSGLARGIDSRAHEAALDVGGATLAVLGNGVDKPWPPGPLAERMTAEGLLLSEFAPGLGPRKHHFPLRNRLISGLADAVVVIEAAYVSGSLITAHWAADQGKQVYALPGRVDHPMARGCHRLLREGAELVESPAEVLRALGELPAPPGAADASTESVEPIITALRGETLDSDELASRLGLSTEQLLPRLAELELAERIVRAPGGLWRLAVAGR